MAEPSTAGRAFDAEALPHLDALYRVALRLTGDETQAEDLVQDTMLKAYRSWRQYRPGTNAKGWLLTILRNTFINDYRRRKHEPVATDLFHLRDLGSSDLVIITRDVPGLFSLIAGCLAANGINILSAQIHTRADGMAIDTFQVNDPFGEAVTEEARWRRTLQSLRRVLSGEQTVELLLAARRGGRPADESVPGPAKVTVDNHLSDTHTVVEVKCPDRVGLLYVITRTLSAHGLDIASARIATEIDQAYDTFYLTDRQGRRLEDDQAMGRVRESLEDALLKPL